jgi:type VI secretion system secreted protein Hcp
MSQADMFLKIEGTRSGVIKGEANDKVHPEAIDISGWRWGMRSASAMGGAGSAAKTSIESLQVFKEVDAASTPMMSVMRANELLKKVTLHVRKAGGTPVDFMIVTLENARITSYDLSTTDATLHEQWTFSFQKITVEYVAQDEKGQKKGNMSFTAEVV